MAPDNIECTICKQGGKQAKLGGLHSMWFTKSKVCKPVSIPIAHINRYIHKDQTQNEPLLVVRPPAHL